MSIALKQVFNKDKTFRPKRKFEPGTQRFELHKRAQASLNSGVDLKAAVQLPNGEDQNDWVAVHVVDFFNRINLIYGTICEFCTERTCPVMSGGPKYEYRWQDDMKYKKPTALPAPQYMNLLMDWIELQINNEDIFPTRVGVPFPKNFLQICKKILCRLFRVFVHVYIHHFDRIILMGAEAHVNTCYKHFYYFVTELNLIDRKELEPLVFVKVLSVLDPKHSLDLSETDEHGVTRERSRSVLLHPRGPAAPFAGLENNGVILSKCPLRRREIGGLSPDGQAYLLLWLPPDSSQRHDDVTVPPCKGAFRFSWLRATIGTRTASGSAEPLLP
nr:PREDICTED: MOB kinase activator 3B [Opisthocomus hoazin]